MASVFLGDGYSAAASAYYDRYIGSATLAAIGGPVDAEAAGLAAGARVVDVGCGGGQVLERVQRTRPDLELVGVEPSPHLLAAAARRTSATLVRGTAERPGVEPGTAGLVLSLFAIKHWPDQQAGFAACAGLAQPGGRVLVAELDAEASLARWRAFVALTRLPGPLQRIYAPLTLRAFVRRGVAAGRLRELAVGAGLEVEEASTVPGLAIAFVRAARPPVGPAGPTGNAGGR